MEWRIEHRPLAGQLRDAILTMLRTEGLKPGDRLPSEQTLTERFGISRAALREAFKLLEEERTVICLHGVGRFVAPENPGGLSEDITRMTSMTELANSLGVRFERQVLNVEEQTAGPEIAKYLNLNPDEMIIVLERAWYESTRAVMVSIDYFPRRMWSGPLITEVFQSSLLGLLEREGNARIAYAKSTIRARSLPARYAAKVGARRNTPWIMMEQINFAVLDLPILYSQDYYNSEHITFRVLRRRR